MAVRRRVVVTGRVQGVSYRMACASEARRLGCAGFVANRADGSVEVEIEGEPDAVQALTEWCRRGPALARVEHLTAVEVPVLGETGFAVRRGR